MRRVEANAAREGQIGPENDSLGLVLVNTADLHPHG
jgi:hypothetical protein